MASLLCSLVVKSETESYFSPDSVGSETHPAFIFNIHWLLIIKGMYLNYKYTSYTEVGKAGI